MNVIFLTQRYEPYELIVDETQNLGDVRVFLRRVAKKVFSGFDVQDLQADIQKRFGEKLGIEKLQIIGANLDASRTLYDDAFKLVSGSDQEGCCCR